MADAATKKTDKIISEVAKRVKEEYKQAEKEAKKEKAQFQKEWENSIIASKRVKREERRRKIKRAMLFMLVVSLIITSIVYIMLLFIDENNVRITASSSNGKKISLSMDNNFWTPYLNGKGPDNMRNLSYNNAEYVNDQLGVTKEDVMRILLDPENFEPGVKSENDYISFAFLLRNDGTEGAIVDCEMTLEYDDVRNLQNCVRVMWGTSFRNNPPETTTVDIFAALSDNSRLEGTGINDTIRNEDGSYRERTVDDGFLEYVAYPTGSDDPSYDMLAYEEYLADLASNQNTLQQYIDIVNNGYFATTPFKNEDFVFQYQTTLPANDIMYCYLVIWIEGSDFECVDSALGGYVKMNINFNAY